MRGGLLIREARLRAGLTQRQLAEMLDVRPSTVGAWERGRSSPRFDIVVRAAEVCGLDMVPRLVDRDPSDELMTERHLSMSVRQRLAALTAMLETERYLWAAGREAGLLAEERLPYEPQEQLQAREMAEVLVRHGVRFVLIGALGAIVHGSPLRTADMDVTPSLDRENLERLGGALRELHARLRVPGVPEGLQFDPMADTLQRGTVWTLTTKFGDLDLAFLPSGTEGYEDLVRNAERARVGQVEVNVASLADIIRNKEAAGREKDLAALPVLRKLLAKQDERER